MIHAVFQCDLGEVGGDYPSQDHASKAFAWFAKRYPNAKIKSIIEREKDHGSTIRELYKEGTKAR